MSYDRNPPARQRFHQDGTTEPPETRVLIWPTIAMIVNGRLEFDILSWELR